ncbi:hypothetical protein IFM47457_01358 [Aspergillus lentulus]|nr:hypothetical protein IFM47457_01358 [Aspergillus lentulus]
MALAPGKEAPQVLKKLIANADRDHDCSLGDRDDYDGADGDDVFYVCHFGLGSASASGNRDLDGICPYGDDRE